MIAIGNRDGHRSAGDPDGFDQFAGDRVEHPYGIRFRLGSDNAFSIRSESEPEDEFLRGERIDGFHGCRIDYRDRTVAAIRRPNTRPVRGDIDSLRRLSGLSIRDVPTAGA